MTRLLGSVRLAIVLAAFVAGSAFYIGHAPAPREAHQPVGAVSQTAIPGTLHAGYATGTVADAFLGAPETGAPSSAVASSPVTAGATARPRPVKTPVATPQAAQKPVRRPQGVQYAIRASWYCGHGSRCTVGHSSGMYAAISPDLRQWAGRQVRVCYQGRCVVVTLIDCLCSREHGIDLYSEPFGMLAPLSTGVITVTLEAV